MKSLSRLMAMKRNAGEPADGLAHSSVHAYRHGLVTLKAPGVATTPYSGCMHLKDVLWQIWLVI